MLENIFTVAQPRCDAALQSELLHGIHMHQHQHQAGASVRIDIAKCKAVMHENAVLGRELGRVQNRVTRLVSENAAEVKRLGALLVQATARQAELEALNMGMRQKLAATTKSLEALTGEAAQMAPVRVDLHRKKVLCVGGRTGSLASYRDVVERVGGQFAHHDDGLEDSQNFLDASLVAADLVICQTGCISHNAYWKVKDFCKRTGKQCVFVENPSASSLARGLEQITGKNVDAIPAEHPGAGGDDGVQASAIAI